MNRADRKQLSKDLHWWGVWHRRNIGLELPTMTAEARLLCSPGRSTKPGRTPSYFGNESAQRIDKGVMAIDKYYRRILFMFYAMECTEEQLRAHTRTQKRTRGAHRWQVDKAHKALYDKLTGTPIS